MRIALGGFLTAAFLFCAPRAFGSDLQIAVTADIFHDDHELKHPRGHAWKLSYEQKSGYTMPEMLPGAPVMALFPSGSDITAAPAPRILSWEGHHDWYEDYCPHAPASGTIAYTQAHDSGTATPACR